MCAKGNPKFSCPTIFSHSDDESLGSESHSRKELFDSSLDTVNVSVNTELPMDSCTILFARFLVSLCPKHVLIWGNCRERLCVEIFVRVLRSSEVISLILCK